VKQNKKKPARNKWHIAIAVLVGLYIVSLFTPFIWPFTRYPYYLIKCGGYPISTSNFAAGSGYEIPSEGYNVTPVVNHYFCTEQQAQAAGYTKVTRHPSN
jgi:hypothetical protein